MITRRPGETDAELRAGIDNKEARWRLRFLLIKLNIKSARALSVTFAGMHIRVPGNY